MTKVYVFSKVVYDQILTNQIKQINNSNKPNPDYPLFT